MILSQCRCTNATKCQYIIAQRQRLGFIIDRQLYAKSVLSDEKEFPMLGSIPHEGFAKRTSGSSVYVAFMAANLSGAIDKSGGDATIDYAKLKVADGTLSAPLVKSATLTAQGITINYLTMLKNQLNLPTDEVVALALTLSGELWIERQPRGTVEQENILISIGNVTTDEILGVYLFTKRTDGSKVSKSVYVQIV